MPMKPETITKTHIELYPLLSSITAAADLISPVLVAHHKKVAFVAATIGNTAITATAKVSAGPERRRPF